MTLTQTVEIPENRWIRVPNEVPTGAVILTFKPVNEAPAYIEMTKEEALASAHEIINKHLPAFKELAK